MKILIGSSSPPDGGSGICAYTKELSEALTKLGAEVYLVSPTPNNWDWVKKHKIYHIPSNQNDNQLSVARNVLKLSCELDIKGAINNDNPILQSISPLIRFPIVSVGHLDKFTIGKLISFHHKWIDYTVAISNDMQQSLISKYGIPITRCPIVHNGVSVPRYNHQSLVQGQSLRVLYAGEYSRRKGSDLLVKALTGDANNWEGIKLEWFGAVPDSIRKRIAIKNVTFHGRVPRDIILDQLEKTDVFLLASREEGCPMAMLEAMSRGVVPIASNGIGAMKWLILSGFEGYICDLDSWPKQMLECLIFLRKHPSVLEEMKDNVRSRFLKEYDIKIVAKKILDLLNRPTVDRSSPPQKVKILKWHRRVDTKNYLRSLLYRFQYRFGLLPVEGELFWKRLDNELAVIKK
jgi:glycosyltransferase involved in cell wall biosynthesis